MDLSGPNEIQVSAANSAFEHGLKSAKDAAGAGRTEEAAKAFEKLFATMLVHELSRGLNQGFFGDGPGADTFTSWFEDHVGETLTAGKGLGLAEAVRASLIRKGAPEEPAPAAIPAQAPDIAQRGDAR
jgi:Rod binding domain-containing protein